MFTSLWPLSALYFVWLVKDWHTPERGCEDVSNHVYIMALDTVHLKGVHYYDVTTRGQKNRVREELADMGTPPRLFSHKGMMLMQMQ